jgi:pimeloyl-ACP methyl ester carboxylesterase
VAERLAVLGASRATIDGAGHHPQLDQPDDLARVVVEFLRANDIA